MKAKKKGPALRPTTGRVREAIFDIIRSRIRNASFLDLYAGSGIVGIEALKQGASRVVFVDASKKRVAIIQDLIQKSRAEEHSTVVTKKALSYVNWAESNNIVFDIIFLDPPYHSDEITNVITAIDSSTILGKSGILIAEHFTKKHLPDKLKKLIKTKDYSYGDTVLTLYEQR